MAIKTMGHFTAIGMRQKVEDPDALVINTCSDNDTAGRGSMARWTWSNPTNRAITHTYEDVEAVSLEALWQGTKIQEGMSEPDPQTLAGDWRRGKGKRPVGAWAGPDKPLIRDQGEARRRIYLPAFQNLLEHWVESDPTVAGWVRAAREHEGPVYLRDFDTGRGVDRDGPMSHAWVLATWLNGEPVGGMMPSLGWVLDTWVSDEEPEDAAAEEPEDAAEPTTRISKDERGQQCWCGCGAWTNPNRRWRPGHDQRAKGKIKRAVKDDRVSELDDRLKEYGRERGLL